MTLSDLDTELLLCKKYLDGSKNPPPEIEFYLTQFFIIRICGEYEKEIKRIVNERAATSSDHELASFVSSRLEVFKHLDMKSLRGNVLKKFSIRCLSSFNDIIKNKQPEISYTSIVSNRHSIAHGGSINLTLRELIEAHSYAKQVLVALSAVLSKT